jgi:hypothetical protein
MFEDNETQYTQIIPCPDCGGEQHSPDCQTKPAKLYREISELLSEVCGGEYGTKNKATLILKLQSIQSLI